MQQNHNQQQCFFLLSFCYSYLNVSSFSWALQNQTSAVLVYVVRILSKTTFFNFIQDVQHQLGLPLITSFSP